MQCNNKGISFAGTLKHGRWWGTSSNFPPFYEVSQVSSSVDQQTYNFIDFRDEMANIENRILEKKIADKKKEELRQKNIAVIL